MEETDRLGLHKFVPEDDLWDLFETWNPTDLQTIDDNVMLRVSPTANGNLLVANATGDAIDSEVALTNLILRMPNMVNGDLIAGDANGIPYDSNIALAELIAFMALATPTPDVNKIAMSGEDGLLDWAWFPSRVTNPNFLHFQIFS